MNISTIKGDSRIIIVTGAAQGIGKAITLKVLQEGLSVIALDKNEPRLEKLDSEIKNQFGNSSSIIYTLDVTQIDQIEKN
jgi:NADP-dependent 3-hydroxy acid dehydrogenase YdfG